MRGSPRSLTGGLILLLTPLTTLAYIVIMMVAIWQAEHGISPLRNFSLDSPLENLPPMAERARSFTLVASAFALVATLPAVAAGWWVLRRGVRPGAAAFAGLCGALHLPWFAFTTQANVMTSAWSPDDQTGFTSRNPAWQPPAMLALLVVATLLIAIAVIALAAANRQVGAEAEP